MVARNQILEGDLVERKNKLGDTGVVIEIVEKRSLPKYAIIIWRDGSLSGKWLDDIRHINDDITLDSF